MMSEKLDLKLEIYLPTSYNPTDKLTSYILDTLMNTFDGLTLIHTCVGLWKHPKTKAIQRDNVTIIRMYTTKVQFENPLLAQRLTFFTVIEQIRDCYNQDTIAFTINDAMEFY